MARTAEEIAAVLRDRIQSGELQPGDRLPTMDALADEYEVNRQTARTALNLLKNEGLVEYKGGRAGTVVRERPAARMVRSRGMERDNLGYYSGANVQHWRLIEGTQTEVTTEPIPADIAGYLGIEPGTPVVARKRANGDPEVPAHRQLTDSWLHPEAVAAVPVIAGSSGLGGIYDRIEEHFEQPILWEEEITAINPSPDEAAALLLPPGVPLLRVIRTSTVKVDGRPLVVEVNDIRMSAELFSVRYPMTRKGAARWPVQPASADFYTS
ncbi:GntR family transcriptional regulator [Kitasatospora sp. GAS204A]|uniref:GntR family transcriptional regulator n=1 Tax=unclassified Kitasatospora TaxID=2633591 RepID=UPI0024739A82|nr:GntR family transcriptional regulator [Kitasatospora sp. GAS204B]MDH6122004.1 GntR family transcriptional regulator [Kitasatospora sp. GAS204B]